MPFIDRLLDIKSLSIVGTAKNTGKTATLNYILRRLPKVVPDYTLGLTSIGLEGERRDQVTQTDKPEITLGKETLFVTAERYYLQKQLSAEVIGIERTFTTSTGRLIYAKAKGKGKVLIAGPPTTQGLRKAVEVMERHGADFVVIDGALSRRSLASPAVAEGLVLATGAAFSAQPEQLIYKTRDIVRQIALPALPDTDLALRLEQVERGIRLVDDKEVIDPGYASALLPHFWQDPRWRGYNGWLYVSGAVHDQLLEKVRLTKGWQGVIVRDFTRLFVSGQVLGRFIESGKEVYCLRRARLMAVTFNPLAPSGYKMDSAEMCGRLTDALGVPVYDIMKTDEAIS
ncbi:MAG: hypothetical protein Q4E10_03320 [Porphyromonas sp.]|nr:hypothetical protein [Porphyromonas sp.]